jgi:Tol biopolymer transport system component
LAFESGVEGHSEVYVMNANGGNPRRLTSSIGSANPSWSTDGRWIYFNSIENVIQKVPAEGGSAVPLNSNPPGWCPIESPDGKSIYFIDARDTDAYNSRLWRIPVEGGESKQVLDSPFNSGGNYAIKDDGIYFISRPDPARGYSIRFLELATGKMKTIAELGKQLCQELAVSPDRRWALYTQTEQSGSDLMLVENFR